MHPASLPSSPSPDEIEFRLLHPADPVPELTRLLHRAYARLAAMGLRYMATHQSDAVTRERAGQGECWVAFAPDGALAGTILFRPAARTSGSPWLDRPEVASVAQFAVAPERQGGGLGARLMDLAERRGSKQGRRRARSTPPRCRPRSRST